MPIVKNSSLRIIVDCERMKYEHTGLYYFCLRLGKELFSFSKQNNDTLSFYLPASAKGCFGNEANYIIQQPLHKLLMPSTKNFDIWHSTFQSTNYFPLHRNIKKLLTVHDLNFMNDEHTEAVKKQKYLSRLQQKINDSNHIVAISKFTLQEMEKFLHLHNKPVSVIYNGCNIEPILKIAEPAIKPTGEFLYTIGTIVDKKNMHVLPALLHNNNYQLVISGVTHSEVYKQKIMEEARNWQVENRVIFTGAVTENDKQWYLQNCTAFLFPSLAEGFGLPVIEAMYFGKPVILSTHSSLPEVGGKEAYYFKNFQPAGMQQTLVESLSDYQSNTLASSAIKQRASMFSWQEAAAKYFEVYHSIA